MSSAVDGCSLGKLNAGGVSMATTDDVSDDGESGAITGVGGSMIAVWIASQSSHFYHAP